MRRVRIYLSHPIRGIERCVDKDQERTIMERNNLLARIAGADLRVVCPEADFYVPAEHEDFVYRAYIRGLLTEEDILSIDCAILKDCDACLLFNHEGKYSHGMRVEYQYAKDSDIPVHTFYTLAGVPSNVKDFIQSIVEVAK